MAEDDEGADGGAVDLEGEPAMAATDMRVGICHNNRDGMLLVGFDMLLEDGSVAHGHFDPNAAIEFYNKIFAVIAEVLILIDPEKAEFVDRDGKEEFDPDEPPPVAQRH